MAIDTQQELEQNEESIDTKFKHLKQTIKEDSNKIYKKLKDRLKKQQTELQDKLGVGSALSAKLSIRTKSVFNASHGYHWWLIAAPSPVCGPLSFIFKT